jgi:acetylornithine deacetylase
MSLNTRQWLEQLVAIDTTSRNSNLELINLLRDNLQQQGITPWFAHNKERTKANLFATLPATQGVAAGQTQGGIVLSGHTDVVPVDGQQWESNPFALTERDGFLFGRGTCDMKGYIAASMALVPEFLTMPRSKPLHLAFSYDEEIGCAGAPVMLAELKERGIQPDGCVVGEPTNMQVVVAHKGINAFSCRVHGRSAHSSLTPQGCNAIEHAARLICAIRDFADAYKQNGPYDQLYDVPFSTMTTNQIRGGIAINTIPELCEFTYEFRNLPGMSPQKIQEQITQYVRDQLLPKMQAEYPDAKIDIAAIASSPALETAEQEAITALVRALTGDREQRKVAYATEAGLFQHIGIPTIVCGPGDIANAHKPNEFVAISQLQRCEEFLRKLGHSLQAV